MLVLMRHGQASFDAADYDALSDLGLEQSRVTGVHLRGREVVCGEVFIGPRERHRATADALVSAWGTLAEHRRDEALDEFANSPRGSHLQDGTDREARLHALMSRVGAWADGELALEGRPTLPEFRDRIGRWVRRELGSSLAMTMAVTSGGVIAAAVCEVMDLPNTMFLPLLSQIRNASMTEIATSRGRPVIVSFNSAAHLPVRLTTLI